MEKTEPTLVPEWLKNAGSSTGGGSTSHTDDHTASRVSRIKSVNVNGHDFGRSSSSERTTSSYFRRSSSSNSSGDVRSYSNFGRNRDRDREKDRYDYRGPDKSAKGDRRFREFSDPLGNTPISNFDRDALRRSQSMVSGKHGDMGPKRVVTDLSDASGRNKNGVVTRGSPVGGVNKAAFERDFPSLRADERAVTLEVGRVPSPGLSTAIQTLPGTFALIHGEKWTSALAEVPMLIGSNRNISSSEQQAAPSSSASGASNSTISLNMAEAVAQGPSRAQNISQLSLGTQRHEELVIRQSRQLIPMTPSMPKTLVLNSSDKPKSKVGQHHYHSISSSIPINHSPHGGPVKGDVPKASFTVGKLHVLKPAREKNGVIPVGKDNLSPTSCTKAVISSSLAGSVSGPAAIKGSPKNMVSECKPILTVLEKRPTSQARSRNDFFNLMRKKSMENPSSAADSAIKSNSLSKDFLDKHAELEVVPADNCPVVEALLSSSPSADCEEIAKTCILDTKKCVSNGKKHSICDPIISEEEEAAFLRSLGWEESDEEGGLTDEEINSFYRDLTKYINSNPSLKILKFLLPLDSQILGTDGVRDAKLES